MVEMVQAWQDDLEGLHRRIAARFARSEQRQRSFAYLKALLSPCERKNGWQLAESIGETTPDGVQRLLNAAKWDAEAVREDLRAYVVEHLADQEAVLILDESGFLKKGSKSVGVKRQYSGTAGKVENCQVGVFLGYASNKGAAFIDRALYLPQEWAEDTPRRQAAGVPDSVAFATKPELAKQMLMRAFSTGVPCGWVTGDEVYGGDRSLRLFLEQRRQPFVVAVAKNEPLMFSGPGCRAAGQIAEQIPSEQWQRLSAGAGAKGPRLYDWAWQELWRLQLSQEEQAWGHWLLVRRSIEKPSEMVYYVVFAPRATTRLETVVGVAGMRWHIEGCLESAKGECGLDQYEVTKWAAWHRHITLSLLAHAFVSVLRSQEGQKGAVMATCYP
jgi:SRSO17 transposase